MSVRIQVVVNINRVNCLDLVVVNAFCMACVWSFNICVHFQHFCFVSTLLPHGAVYLCHFLTGEFGVMMLMCSEFQFFLLEIAAENLKEVEHNRAKYFNLSPFSLNVHGG